jgi:hypothetical protein
MIMAPRLAVVALLAVLASGSAGATTGPAGTLDWRAARNRVDARIERWPLQDLLATIAASTGWEVYLEPGASLEVTTRFENLSQTDALRRLLGRLDFALLPQPEGPTKLFVFRTSAAEATERVAARARLGRTPGGAIPGERIVMLADGADPDALARRLGARIAGRMPGMRAYRLVFESEERAREAVRQMARDEAVQSVETNIVIAPPAVVQPASAGGGPSLALRPDASPSADTVVIGLVDTAVQTQDAHVTSFLAAGVSVAGDPAAAGETPTHGTTMAATILDAVSQALRESGDTSGTVPLSILPIDVYGPNETTSTFDVANGIYEAITRHANLVNLSLAADGDSVLVRALIEEGARRGVLFFGAAGNDGGTAPVYPAADPGVVSVTAAAAGGGVATWANSGTWIDAIAPGEHVFTLQDRSWFGEGTSYSTSMVSGWAAGLMADGVRSRRQVERKTLSRWGFDQ